MTEFGHLGNPDVFPFSMLSNSNQKRRDEVNFLDAQLHGCLDPLAPQSAWDPHPQPLPP